MLGNHERRIFGLLTRKPDIHPVKPNRSASELHRHKVRKAEPFFDSAGAVCTLFMYYFFENFFRPIPARQIRPVPKRNMVAGTGTVDVRREAIKSPGLSSGKK